MFDMLYQPYDVLNTYAMVNKVVYTKRIGNFVFSPGLKFRLYKKARSESLQPLRHYVMRIPLIMFQYIISPSTQVLLGMQGFPGFEFKYTDFIMDMNNYTKKNYLLQLQNRTDYFGYQIFVTMGLRLNQLTYDRPYRKIEEYKETSSFVTVHCGY